MLDVLDELVPQEKLKNRTSSSEQSLIQSVPIVQQAFYFLEHANSDKGIKLTEKGMIGRNFVQSFWDRHLKNADDMPFRPTREFECPEVTRVHFLLAESKYVRKFKGYINLTPKGTSFLKQGAYEELYMDLVRIGIYNWNWGFEDRYPDYEFIQQAGPLLIARLHDWPSKTLSSDQIFNEFFEVAEKNTDGDQDFDLECKHWTLEEELARCFNVRFFRRFCVPFGILKDTSDWGFNWKTTDVFEKTEFFISENTIKYFFNIAFPLGIKR